MKCKFEYDGHCCNCGAAQYMIECKQPCETIVTMTNADRIRAMSDEELAEYITGIIDDANSGSVIYSNRKEERLEWLKQDAEE